MTATETRDRALPGAEAATQVIPAARAVLQARRGKRAPLVVAIIPAWTRPGSSPARSARSGTRPGPRTSSS